MPPQTVVRVFGRFRDEFAQRLSEVGRRLERCQAERVHEHQRAELLAAFAGKAGRDSAAEQLPHQCRWRRAGVLDQLAEPRQHAFGVQQAITDLGCTMTWKIGRDYAMRRHESGITRIQCAA